MGAKPDPATTIVDPSTATTIDPAAASTTTGPETTTDPNALPPVAAEDPYGGAYDPSATGGYDPTAMGDPAQMMQMMGSGIVVALIIGLAILVFMIFCWWKIFSKVGHPGALSLVFLSGIIPLIGPFICLGLFIWFAFADWPALKYQQAVKT